MRMDLWLGRLFVRWLPMAATIVGVVGLVAADRLFATSLSGVMIVVGVSLELLGWGRSTRAYARTLGTAALAGAIAGTAGVIAIEIGTYAHDIAAIASR